MIGGVGIELEEEQTIPMSEGIEIDTGSSDLRVLSAEKIDLNKPALKNVNNEN